MGYESAISTKLLATHCAACSRPLRDADSVEAGIGPDCRAKYGYGSAQGVADWGTARALAAKLGPEDRTTVSENDGDAKKIANVFVQRAAVAPRESRGGYVEVIAALGYRTLAAKLADAAGEVIEIKRKASTYSVITPYRPEFVDGLKAARVGARWDPSAKAWEVPADERARAGLWRLVKTYFPGAFLSSDRGLTRIAA
jgi:hypothetical protein